MHPAISTSPVIQTSAAVGKVWLDPDTFYMVAANGCVTIWGVEGDEAIQLGARMPGTSGKSADTIARDMHRGN